MADDINHLIHNVRNPLNCISVNAELGKLTLERTQDVQKAIAIFDTILKECRSCSDKLAALKSSLADEQQQGDQ